MSAAPAGSGGGELRHEVRVSIRADSDIIEARQKGRALAALVGFTSTELTLIATAISELARNIVVYAHHGEVIIQICHESDKRGILVVAQDEGPGIPDIRQALRDGFSTSGSLGLGLPGVKRLMDELEIVSKPEKGTTVKAKKWVK